MNLIFDSASIGTVKRHSKDQGILTIKAGKVKARGYVLLLVLWKKTMATAISVKKLWPFFDNLLGWCNNKP